MALATAATQYCNVRLLLLLRWWGRWGLLLLLHGLLGLLLRWGRWGLLLLLHGLLLLRRSRLLLL